MSMVKKDGKEIKREDFDMMDRDSGEVVASQNDEKEELFKFINFFVVCDFAAVLTEFLQHQFFRSFHFIFLRDVITVLANLTHESDGDAMFAFFGHKWL